MEKQFDMLKLENQLCFPLYVCSKELIKKYKPYLDQLDLTYTQYITMMVLWEHKQMSVKELGAFLYLDSGTLTPLLKKLEQKGWIERNRLETDERVLSVTITNEGYALREEASRIPTLMKSCIKLDFKEASFLKEILHKILED